MFVCMYGCMYLLTMKTTCNAMLLYNIRIMHLPCISIPIQLYVRTDIGIDVPLSHIWNIPLSKFCYPALEVKLRRYMVLSHHRHKNL